jgi:hypothetical protein
MWRIGHSQTAFLETPMSSEESFRQERRVAIDRWADTYTARLDQELTTAWHDLAHRLEQGIANLSWSELAFGPGEGFQRHCQGDVQQWVERHVTPIIDKACEELHNLLGKDVGRLEGNTPGHFRSGGNLKAMDVVKGLALPGGVLIGGTAVSAAIVTTTKLLILTTVIVDWPLLIGGLIGGGILALFGGSQLARLREELRRRCRDHLLPQIHDAVVGNGVQRDGHWMPSLLVQLRDRVQQTAEAARSSLDGGQAR